MKRVLFIGGTGTISTGIVKKLIENKDWDIYLLNRGNNNIFEGKVHQIIADINNIDDVKEKLNGLTFDVVGEFIGFTKEHVERDYYLFKDVCKQYIYISSASVYTKPSENYIITETTSLNNPYWKYARDKQGCEEYLLNKFKNDNFPVTIVRPSHTYGERNLPFAVRGKNGFWQIVKRMKEGKPAIVHGDGSSLWHLTFNSDFAIGYIGLMANPKAIGEIFQITGDEVLTWDQIYRTIGEALGVKPILYHVSSDFLSSVGQEYDLTGNLLGDKAVSVHFDNSKLKRLVPNMKTNVTFKDGVKIVLDYVLHHKECQIEDPEFDEWCDKVINALEEAKKII